jgi:hypothetical protein
MATLRTSLAAAVVAAPLALTGALAAPAFAGEEDQGQGIIEVDGREFETDPGNEPHVGCIFQVDFKNYDEGDTFADVRFELQPPTSEPDNTMRVDGDTRVFIGEDPAEGQEDLDGTETYTLSFSGPPAAQGYHVKLTINAEGTANADKRFKVYYIQCPRRFPAPGSNPNPGPNTAPDQGVTPTVINGGQAGTTDGSTDGSGVALGLLVALGVIALASPVAGGWVRRRPHGS